MEQDRMKKWLYWAGIFALIVFAFSAFSYVSSYAKSVEPTSSYRSFAVAGQGKLTAKNDIAVFTYGVLIEGGKDISAIKSQSDTKTGKIQKFLKDQGIDEKDITTVNYSLEPKYQYFPCPTPLPGAAVSPCQPQEIVGYTLRQTDSVKIRNLAKANEVISGIVAAGANEVSQMTFTIDDRSELETKAKGLAVKEAIARAKQLAQTAGFKVGKIVSIEESGVYPYYEAAYGRGGAADMKSSIAAPLAVPQANLNPGSNEIISNVVVRFEIK